MFFSKKLKICLNEINLIKIFCYYLIVSGLFYFFFLLFSKHDNDFYGFLYYGQRLVNYNELIWTKEFDDKFPIVQYIFTIPAYFNSIEIWGVLVLILLIITSILLFFTIKDNIFENLQDKYLNLNSNKVESNKLKKEIDFKASLLASAAFFYINIFTPSSIFHINSLSSSLFTMSLCIILFAVKINNKLSLFL